MAQQLGQKVPALAGGARGGPGNRTPAIPVTELDNVRSYAIDMETKEVLHVDRIRHPWALDVVKALERLAEISVAGAEMWVWFGNDRVMLKLSDLWRVKIMRDAVIIKAGDCALVADRNFLMLCIEEGGRYTPMAKGETITWDGTEEYFTPDDIMKLAKEVARRVLEQARWLV